MKGEINSPQLLSQINIVIPREASRNPITFYFEIPASNHHFNSSLLSCFRLYNSNNICQNFDIFFDDFSKDTVKEKIISKFTV